MIRRILVPLDGSDLAGHVLPQVEDLARRLPAEVWFVEVVEVYPRALATDPTGVLLSDTEAVFETLDDLAKAAARHLARLSSEWQERGVAARWRVLRGEPAFEIVEFARSNAIDLIAMSTHGRSGLDRVILGSVAERVVLEAGLPVLVVRPVDKSDAEARAGG